MVAPSLPQGRPLAQLVRQLWKEQEASLLSSLRLQGAAAFIGFHPEMWFNAFIERIKPIYARYLIDGREALSTRLRRSAANNKSLAKSVLALPWVFNEPEPDDQFTIYNPEAINFINQYSYAFAQSTLATTKLKLSTAYQRLQQALTQGIEQGEALRTITSDVMRIFRDPVRAQTIAATECLTGDTVIYGANVKAIYRRQYSGKLFKVITESGLELTGTPNHPVLTNRGWIALGELKESDYLVADSRDINSLPSVKVNEQHPPATLNEIFGSLSAIGVCERSRCSLPDFHGDGLEGNVDVLSAHSELRYGAVASRTQLIKDFGFSEANLRKPSLLADGGIFKMRVARRPHSFRGASKRVPIAFKNSSYCAMGNFVFPRDLDGAHAVGVFFEDCIYRKVQQPWVPSSLNSSFHCRGMAANNSSGATCLLYSGGIALEPLGKHKRTHSALVKFDRISSLTVTENWNGHVYNLETTDGHYNANGIYTHNCSRAYHAGQELAAKQSGVVAGKRWLASSDACERCLALDGKVVALGEPFIVLPEGGPYATVMYPPLHPKCQCSWTEVLNEEWEP